MLKYGIVGYGYWGPNLTRIFNQAADSKVLAVADQFAANRAKVKGLYPAIDVYDDAVELIADTRIDVIAIATPISTHYELAAAALEAGKHVIVEKPLCANSEEASRLVELAARKNRQIFVDHTFVYTGAVRKMADLVEAGKLGRVLYYDSIRINLGLYQRDVNVIWDLVVHDLAILFRLMPQRPEAISAIYADPLRTGVPAIAYVTLFYPDNVVAHTHASWLAPVKIRQVLLGGDKSMVVYDDLNPSEKIRIYDKGVELAPSPEQAYALKVEYRHGDMLAPQVDSREALAVMAEHANSSFMQNVTPITNGEVGLNIVRLLELADRSAQLNGEVLRVDVW
jgi:predicted dehydrogenase